MPTPILIDGFEHQTTAGLHFATPNMGIWESAGGGTPTFPAGRNGSCMQIVCAATAVHRSKDIVGTPSIIVGSIYIKSSTISATDKDLFHMISTSFSSCMRLYLMSDGRFGMQFKGGSVNQSTNVLADGNWHRVDFRWNGTGDPCTGDWSVDGSPQPGSPFSTAGTANPVQYLRLGDNSGAMTFTAQYDDLVLSSTSADYPLGAHDVLFGNPTGDGTHAAGTNVIEDNAGTDIVSPNAFPLINDITSSPSTDYIQQVATGASNYAEVTFDDQPGGKTIWGVEGVAALFASGTAASADGTTRIVDASNNTLTNIYAGDMSETSLNYRRAIITAPAGGWDGAGYAGVKARVGFSGAVTSQPRWAALMLQYAVTDATAPPSLRKLQVNVTPRRW